MEYLFYGAINGSLEGLYSEPDRDMLYRVEKVKYLIGKDGEESPKKFVIKDKTILLRSNYEK